MSGRGRRGGAGRVGPRRGKGGKATPYLRHKPAIQEQSAAPDVTRPPPLVAHQQKRLSNADPPVPKPLEAATRRPRKGRK
eukprot:304334-Chlamydomonas_euryale.AAC.1